MDKRFSSWLKHRMPATTQITLNSRNVFILPSKTGVHFLMSCFILFLLGTNYQNNLVLFLVFFLCSFMVTCLLLSYQNMANLTITRTDTPAQFAKTDCQFQLRVKHPKVTARDLHFSFQENSSALQAVSEEERILLYGCSTKRGYFNPGRVTVRSQFPFGLFTVWTHIDFGFNVLLYPEPLENKMQQGQLSTVAQDKHFKQSVMGVDQFSTLKTYQQGESLKSVAWKQLAQGRGWLTKQFEQSASGEVILDINTLNHLDLETRLSFLCYQVIEFDKMHQRYSLILPTEQIPLGSGLMHKNRCLHALAVVGIKEPIQ